MSHNRLYKSLINAQAWRALRAKVLSARPLCEVCATHDRITPATEVHHIRPVESVTRYEDMKALAYDESNLLCLCHECHANIHRDMRTHTKDAVKANKDREVKQFISRFLKP